MNVAIPAINDPLALAMLPLRLAANAVTDLPVTGLSMGSLTRNASHLRIQKIEHAPRFGTVILYITSGKLVAHRIIGRSRGQGLIIAKGDACPQADRPIRTDQVLGQVMAVIVDGHPVIPMRLSLFWSFVLAVNSVLQHHYRKGFPRISRRLDFFRVFNQLLERIEQWIH